jgi:hypothetical protein
MKNILRLLTSGLVAAVLSLAAQAAELAPGAYSVGQVTGDVTYKLADSAEYAPLAAGTALPQGATIKTGADSSALLVFASGSTATVIEDSEVEVTKFEQEVFSGPIPADSEPAVSNTEIKVLNGSVVNQVNKLKKGSNYTVNTPVGAAGVRGTLFMVSYDTKTGSYSVSVVEGGVEVLLATGVAKKVGGNQQLRNDGDGVWEVYELPKDVRRKILKIIRRYERANRLSRGDRQVDIDITQNGVTVSPE